MRGRVSAINGMFIGASNELGAFESGVVADLAEVWHSGGAASGAADAAPSAPRFPWLAAGWARCSWSRYYACAPGLAPLRSPGRDRHHDGRTERRRAEHLELTRGTP